MHIHGLVWSVLFPGAIPLHSRQVPAAFAFHDICRQQETSTRENIVEIRKTYGIVKSLLLAHPM